MSNHFKPTAGRYGVMVAFFQGRQVGNLTANTTNTISFGGVHRKSLLARVNASVTTVPADSDGTILATLKKYDASADAAVTLSSALDLEALTAKESTAFTITSTLTTAEKTLDEGDVLFVEVVNNSAAIDTQPANLVFTAEVLVQS